MKEFVLPTPGARVVYMKSIGDNEVNAMILLQGTRWEVGRYDARFPTLVSNLIDKHIHSRRLGHHGFLHYTCALLLLVFARCFVLRIEP